MIEGWIVYVFALPMAVLVAWRGHRRGHSAFQVAIRALFVVYLGWLAGATFFPLPMDRDLVLTERAEKGIEVSFVPGRSTRDYIRWGSSERVVVELGGNVLVFAPFGFLLPLIAARTRAWRRTAVVGLLLSLSIELGQLAISLALGYSYRVADVDDVILNVTGVLLGFTFWRLLRGKLPGVAVPRPGPAGDSVLGADGA